MEIEFTLHALERISRLNAQGFTVSRELVREVIESPERLEMGYGGRLIAQIQLDIDHVLRVVYEQKSNKALVVTLYPGRRSCYEKD